MTEPLDDHAALSLSEVANLAPLLLQYRQEQQKARFQARLAERRRGTANLTQEREPA